MKKSAIVRNLIANAKAQGLSAQDVIEAVMNDTGFQRQLARVYVNNNWSKVEAAAQQPAKAPQAAKGKTLSMSKDAIRKREARARAKAEKEILAAQAAGCQMDPQAAEEALV